MLLRISQKLSLKKSLMTEPHSKQDHNRFEGNQIQFMETSALLLAVRFTEDIRITQTDITTSVQRLNFNEITPIFYANIVRQNFGCQVIVSLVRRNPQLKSHQCQQTSLSTYSFSAVKANSFSCQ